MALKQTVNFLKVDLVRTEIQISFCVGLMGLVTSPAPLIVLLICTPLIKPLSPRAKLNVDSYCAAMWDEGWYRGRIVSVARNECEVYFVDYGNTDVVENSNIRGLTKQFKQEPMYAIKCRLEGIDPTMMEQMTNIFSKFLVVSY